MADSENQVLLSNEEYTQLFTNLEEFYTAIELDMDKEEIISEFCHILGCISAISILDSQIQLSQMQENINKMEAGDTDEEQNVYAQIQNKFYGDNWELISKYIRTLSSSLLQGDRFELPLDMDFCEISEEGFDFAAFALGFVGIFVILEEFGEDEPDEEDESQDALYKAFVPMYYMAQIMMDDEFEESDETDTEVDEENQELDEDTYLSICENLENIIEDIYEAKQSIE